MSAKRATEVIDRSKDKTGEGADEIIAALSKQEMNLNELCLQKKIQWSPEKDSR